MYNLKIISNYIEFTNIKIYFFSKQFKNISKYLHLLKINKKLLLNLILFYLYCKNIYF
jgi:hypothetical protein